MFRPSPASFILYIQRLPNPILTLSDIYCAGARSDSRNSSLAIHPLPISRHRNAELRIPFRILISHHFQMTPTFRWVFLLALVGRAASVPRPLVVDACALLCNPGAETESERERDPVQFPRYPKVNCKLQSDSDKHQAWIIASHCLKLCNNELSIPSEVNCFALRSSLAAHLGCYCEALTPLSPNTMRLHESWRLNFLVNELADDILNAILDSPLDTYILCEIHQELFKDVNLRRGTLVNKCESQKAENVNISIPQREERSAEEEVTILSPALEEPIDHPDMHEPIDEVTVETETDATDEPKDDVPHQTEDKLLHHKLFSPMPEQEDPHQDEDFEHYLSDWNQVCEKMCRYERGNKFCQCKNSELER